MYFLVLTTVEVPVWDEEKIKRVHIKEALSTALHQLEILQLNARIAVPFCTI